jgi:hypothetical protein
MMDFYTVLDQVVDPLRRRGRVSYRALERQFALDDKLVADLKAELRYAHYPIEEDHDQFRRKFAFSSVWECVSH